MNKIAISSDFFESFSRLPRPIQDKIKDFFNKISKNSRILGLNLEKINKINDKQLYSARIDDTYRVIIYKDDTNGVYHVLWIDHHDKAYSWAKGKTNINIEKNNVSVINSDYYFVKGLSPNTNNKLFSKISTRNLLALGVPLKDLALVRNIYDLNSFYQIKELLPCDVFANLEWLAVDTHVQLIIDNNKRTKEAILDFIKQEVLYPAINHPNLDLDIKERVKNTLKRLEMKKGIREISDFFEDALVSKSGNEIYTAFQQLGLKGFEDIAEDVRRLCLI
jgi:mRNA-degrading endonuclease RelE of RelBE toxin-antitoxin system